MTQRLKWWQLYLLGAATIGLLLLGHFVFSNVTVRHIAEIGIVLIGYGMILAWLGSQARALDHEDRAHDDTLVRDDCILITKQQAAYRLALVRRKMQLQKRE